MDNLLVIALRRANYAQLRTLRARRQNAERAWVDGWTEAFIAACTQHQGGELELYRPDGFAALPSRCRNGCTCCECREHSAGNS